MTRCFVAGDIHIWDRESSTLLHHVQTQTLDRASGDLTCVAWNPTTSPFMFASGTHDGAVKIWTAPPKVNSPESPEDEEWQNNRHGTAGKSLSSMGPILPMTREQGVHLGRTPNDVEEQLYVSNDERNA